VLAVITAVLLSAAATPASADTVYLPRPQSEQLNGSELFEILGSPRDRLPAATVPGPVTNDEVIEVAVASDGSVHDVRDRQRIGLTGTGDFLIREAGPARSAVALGEVPPVLDFGDVVWQGFSPGSRELGAELTLDPQIEAAHLPVHVRLTFAGAGHPGASPAPAGTLPGPGTVTLTVVNATSQAAVLPRAADAAAATLATALDRVLTVARTPDATRLATVRTILPSTVQVRGATTTRTLQNVPFRLHGTLQIGGGARPATVNLDGLLQDTARFTLPVSGTGTLKLDLSAEPVLGERTLAPPHGLQSWHAWAATGPSAAERRSAFDLLIRIAAAGSRASAYSPYLGPHLGPGGVTVFHYTLLRAAPTVPARPTLRPRPLPIGLTILAALLLVSGGVIVWRRT
jgi:hypothetical protein